MEMDLVILVVSKHQMAQNWGVQRFDHFACPNLGRLAIHWLRCLLKAQPPTRKRPSQLHVAVVAFGDACGCSQSTLKSPEKMVKDG